MKSIIKYVSILVIISWSTSPQAMTLWAVESGQNPFANAQAPLVLSPGTTTLDLYYDVDGDTSYGYDFILAIAGTGSISNVGGGDSDLGNAFGSGWRQFGGDIFGETGSSVLAFSFDFTADAGTSLTVSGTYTDAGFEDTPIPPAILASVTVVPVPAAVWLFGTALGLLGWVKRKAA